MDQRAPLLGAGTAAPAGSRADGERALDVANRYRYAVQLSVTRRNLFQIC